MKVTNNNINKTTYYDAQPGECFSFGNTLYIETDEGRAVNLENGLVTELPAIVPIIKYPNAEIIY